MIHENGYDDEEKCYWNLNLYRPMTKDSKMYRIFADYQKPNINTPCYYVVAKNKKEAKEKFNRKISWLKVYYIEEIEDESLVERMYKPPYVPPITCD